MKTLLKPILKKHLFMCIAMVIIAAIGMSLLSSFVSFNNSMAYALDDYIESYGYADAVISVKGFARSEAINLARFDGVDLVDTRLSAETVMTREGGSELAVNLYSYKDSDHEKMFFWEQEELADEGGVLIEYNFAHDEGIALGEKLSIDLGDYYLDAVVCGIISSPETLGMKGSDSWGTNPKTGPIYLNAIYLEESSLDDIITQFKIMYEPGIKRSALLKDLTIYLFEHNYDIIESYNYADSPVERMILNNIEPIYTIALLVPGAFYLIVLCVLFLCMSMLVKQCREDIGILRALGYSQFEIVKVFSVLMLLVSGAAFILSIPIDLAIMGITTNFYRDYYPIPELPGVFNIPVIIASIIIEIIVSQIATIISCRQISSIEPALAIRDEAAENAKIPFAVRTAFKNAKPALKFSMTSLFRSKKRLIFLVVCMAAAVAMIFSSLSYKASSEYIITQLFDERLNYDAMIVFDCEVDDEKLAQLKETANIPDAERGALYIRSIEYTDKHVKKTVIAANAGTGLISIPDVGTIPEKGIVLEKDTADAIGTEKGQCVVIDDAKFEIAAVSLQATSKVSYISSGEAERLGEPDYGVIFTNVSDKEALEKALKGIDGYMFTTFNDDVEKNVSDLFDTYYFIVRILIIFAMAVGFVVIISSSRSMLLERRREIAIMRSQGYSIFEIGYSWMAQALLQYAFAIILGLPAGVLIAKLIISQLRTAERTYLYASGISEILITALLTLLFVIIGIISSLPMIRNWSLTKEE